MLGSSLGYREAIMTVPDFQSLMLPVLTALSGAQPLHVSAIRDQVAETAGVSLEDRKILNQSGQPVFENRVGWALSHLKGAGLVQTLRRGVYELTSPGRRLLEEPPARVDMKVLQGYAAYRAWRRRDAPPTPEGESADGRPGQQERRSSGLDVDLLEILDHYATAALAGLLAQPGTLERLGADGVARLAWEAAEALNESRRAWILDQA